MRSSRDLAGIGTSQDEELPTARGGALGGPSFEPGPQTDVGLDREVREQPDLLDDVADAAAEPGGFERVRGLSGDPDLSRRVLEQAIDQLEGRGLARPAATEQHERFPVRDAEGHVLDEDAALREGVPRPPHLEDRAHPGPASAIRNRRSSLVPCHRTASPASPRIRSSVSGAYL